MVTVSFLVLSGCLYPEAEKRKNSGPMDVHITSVADAIMRYHKETRVYPILNSTLQTPIYEKYIIDMNKLYPNYLGYLPANAFESGGPHLYVLVDMEHNPTVKLIDLTTSSKVESMQRLINEYKFSKGEYPFGEATSSFTYTIDYQKLKVSVPEVQSPFSGKSLPLHITNKGEVIVDYTLDIGIYMNQGYTFNGDDVRGILVQNSFFVPVKSVRYEWVNNELIPAQ